MGEAFFNSIDRLDRLGGSWLDALGLAPRESPHECVWSAPGVRLRRYGVDRQAGPVLILVPAPIKRHYIWDLEPSCSVVQRALARGWRVHLVEWTQAPHECGLDRYVELLGHCIAETRRCTGARPHAATHSLGGTLGAIYAARHPRQLASLVLLEAPLRLGDAAGALGGLLSGSPSAVQAVASFRRVPGSVLDLAAVLASPREFVWQRHLDAFASTLRAGAARRHLLALRWALDQLPMPGRLFADVVDRLYRNDELMRGCLVVQGRRVAPHDVVAPLLAVIDPRSEVVPGGSTAPFVEAAASADKRLLRYDGDVGVAVQHLGPLIGDNAHRQLWPQIFAWLEAGAR